MDHVKVSMDGGEIRETDHVISIDGSETRKTPNERLEALKGRNLPTPYNQRWLGDGGPSKIMDLDLYEATKEGGVEKFINALEKVSQSRELALLLIFNQVTPSGDSLLHVAASFGKEDVVELILIYFPYLMTRKNSSEDTPLHVAVQTGSLEATRKLICLRGDSEVMYWKNKDSKSPLYLAVENYKPSECKDRKGAGWEILQLLLEEYARDKAYAVKIKGMSPVLAAIETYSCVVLAGILLREVVDRLPKLLHVRGEDGGTPLHFVASSCRYWWAMDLLLERCPDLARQTDENGSYPLHIACQLKCGHARHYFTIKKLIEHTWPNLAEIKNGKGQNILHVAAEAGNHRVVRCMLQEYGRPVGVKKLANSKDVDGNTPLHLASMHHHCLVMLYLTNYKRSDVKLLNNEGLTALDVALGMEYGSLSTTDPAAALLGCTILFVHRARRSKSRDILSPREQSSGASKSPRAKWIKDQVNTLLLVATLVASVTFTAGITLPGGYNASGDPHPGTATALHHGVFQLFVIANTLAMYSSILAVVVLFWGLSRDFYVAELAYYSAGPLLLMALTGMTVAFFAAVTVAVSKLTWLGNLVLSLGVLYLAMVVKVFSPFAARVLFGIFVLLAIIPLVLFGWCICLLGIAIWKLPKLLAEPICSYLRNNSVDIADT